MPPSNAQAASTRRVYEPAPRRRANPYQSTGDVVSPNEMLGVIVVNYRTAGLTIRSVASILEQRIAGLDHIVVIDNNSRDGSVGRIRRAFPALRVIASETNGGFGAGVNFGLKWRDEDYVLILNPDTYFENNSVLRVVSYMKDHPDIGIAGLDLVNRDGSRQYSARRFYSLLDVVGRRVGIVGNLMHKRMDRHLMKDAWRSHAPFDAEWIMGTGFVAKRDLIMTLGGMDEDYFLYMEDVDLCARVWNAGFRVVCFPEAQLVHDHQRSSATNPFSFAARQHIISLLKFSSKFSVPLVRQPGIDRIRKSYKYAEGNASQLSGV